MVPKPEEHLDAEHAAAAATATTTATPATDGVGVMSIKNAAEEVERQPAVGGDAIKRSSSSAVLETSATTETEDSSLSSPSPPSSPSPRSTAEPPASSSSSSSSVAVANDGAHKIATSVPVDAAAPTPTTTTTPPTPASNPPNRNHYYYLTPQAASALPTFKYNGTDLSLLYRYVLSPWATYLVHNWTPRTMAPNTITLIGLCWMVASYALIWYHCPNMDEAYVNPNDMVLDDTSGGGTSSWLWSFYDGNDDTTTANATTNASLVPTWIFAFNALAMLTYQTLDNMDGKQSRRTVPPSSSPLGLLFDHGCDAINSIFGSVNWICAMGLSPAVDMWQILVLVLAPMAAFYVTTWEEYWTHRLVLPIINGPSDGLCMGATLFAVSSVWGVEYWQTSTWYDGYVGPYVVRYLPTSVSEFVSTVVRVISPAAGESMRNCDVVAVVTLLALSREVSTKVVTVVRKYGFKSISGLLPMTILTIAPLIIGYADPTILSRHPRTCMHLLAALFVESVTQLMFDHMTTMKFRPVRVAFVPLAAYAAHAGLVVGTGWSGGWLDGQTQPQLLQPERADDFLVFYTAAVIVYLAVKFRIVIHEICDLLGIWCFDIVTPHPAAAAAASAAASASSAGAVVKKGEKVVVEKKKKTKKKKKKKTTLRE